MIEAGRRRRALPAAPRIVAGSLIELVHANLRYTYG